MSFESSDYDALQERYADILKKLTYIECDVGWFDIIDKCLSDLLKISYETGLDIQVVQIKEKFGGLRVYYDLEDSENNEDIYKQINTAIDAAEDESYTVCEVCGEQGSLQRKGWWKTLCIMHQHNLG